MNTSFKFKHGLQLVVNNKVFTVDTYLPANELRLINIADGSHLVKPVTDLLLGIDKKTIIVLEEPQKQTDRKITKLDFAAVPREHKEVVARKHAYISAVQTSFLRTWTKETIQPIIDKVAGKIKDPSPPSFSSVYRWLAQVKKNNSIRALLPANDRKGNHHCRLHSEVQRIIEQTIRDCYLRPERRSVRYTHNLIKARVLDYNQTLPEGEPKLEYPSKKAVNRYISKLDRYTVLKHRYGVKVAEQECRLSGEPERSVRVLERVEIDHTIIDVLVVDDILGIVLGRPTLTIAIDVFSRCILGYFISFEPPSGLAILRCLSHAIRPKQVRELYRDSDFPPIFNEWIMCGFPETAVVDCGKDFTGYNFEEACLDLDINIQQCPIAKPWYKGTVERMFRTLNTSLFHTMPGTTFSNVNEKGDYTSEKKAVVTLDLLHWSINKWIVDVYHQEKHSGTGFTPAQLWEDSIQDFEPRYATSADVLETILGYTEERTITTNGIMLHNIRYSCPSLAHLRTKQQPGTTYRIKYNPSNLGEIQIFDPTPEVQDWITLPAVNQEYANGISLWQHRIHQRYAKENYNSKSMENLLRAKKEIFDTVNDAVKNIRKSSVAQKIARYLQFGLDNPNAKLPEQKPEKKQAQTSAKEITEINSQCAADTANEKTKRGKAPTSPVLETSIPTPADINWDTLLIGYSGSYDRPTNISA